MAVFVEKNQKYFWWSRNLNSKFVLQIFFCITIGFLFLLNFNFFRIIEVEEYNNKEKNVIGIVNSEGQKKSNYWQYILKDNFIENKSIKSKILLKSKKELQYGDKIKVKVELEIPKHARNENLFDYSKYLKTLDIYIIAESDNINVLDKNCLNMIEKISFIVKNKVRQFTSSNLKETEAGILNALIIGDESLLESDLEDTYKRSGMLHLLVVSGGHVVFILLLMKYIFSFLIINKNVEKYIYILVIFLYIFITGATPSIMRAGIGTIIVIIAGIIGRQNDSFTTLGLVALILTIINPNVLFSLSFQLSFGGVIGIIVAYPKLNQILNKFPKIIRESLALTLAAQLFVTPITIYNFNAIYWASIISNVIALNLSSIIMMFGIIVFFIYLIIPPIVKFPMKILSLLIVLMNKVADFFCEMEFLTQNVVSPSNLSIVLYYVLLFYIFMKDKNLKNEKALKVVKHQWIPLIVRRNFKMIYIVCVIVSILILNIKLIDSDKSLKVAVIDVGHGDSILLTTPNDKQILIDTGDKYYQGEEVFDSGERTIVPYLLKKRITNIDLIILTHMDADHIGGFKSIVNSINVKNLGVSVNNEKKDEYINIKKLAKEAKINIKTLKRGDVFYIDNVKIEVLMPENNKEIIEENNDSIVLLVEYEGKKLLFMGDLEKEGELRLLDLENDLNIDILKVGHHGSNTSTIAEFVNETKPQIALISVGNRFKSIPGQDVLERLKSVYAKVYRTDQNGEIKVKIDKGNVYVKTTY